MCLLRADEASPSRASTQQSQPGPYRFGFGGLQHFCFFFRLLQCFGLWLQRRDWVFFSEELSTGYQRGGIIVEWAGPAAHKSGLRQLPIVHLRDPGVVPHR